jgi:hypothetical protein
MSIFIECRNLGDLHVMARDAVRCPFDLDEGHAPTIIGLRFKADDVVRGP